MTITKMSVNPFDVFKDGWALLTAGTPEHFNTMTISWGGLGTLWGMDVATVYVKPLRYTYAFMESNDFFTLSFFEEEYRSDLKTLGSTSGRDGNKLAKTELTPITLPGGVGFQQAFLTLICKKIYWQDLSVENMPPESVAGYYLTEAPHRMYIGEVRDMRFYDDGRRPISYIKSR